MTPPGEKVLCGCPAGGGRRRSTRHRPLVTDYHLPRTSRCSSHSRCARGLVACDGAHRITWTCSPQWRPTCHVNGSSASSGSTPHARPPPSLPLPARTCPWRYVVVVGESAHHRGRPRRAIRLPGPTYDRSAAATLDLATGPCSTDAKRSRHSPVAVGSCRQHHHRHTCQTAGWDGSPSHPAARRRHLRWRGVSRVVS